MNPARVECGSYNAAARTFPMRQAERLLSDAKARLAAGLGAGDYVLHGDLGGDELIAAVVQLT